MPGMTYQPGDVLLIPFPFSDRLASKKRPVLLLTTPDEMGDIICLPITSSIHHADGFRLLSEHFREGQLPKASWVRTGKAYTLNNWGQSQFSPIRQPLPPHLPHPRQYRSGRNFTLTPFLL